jgi:hypothetical protein
MSADDLDLRRQWNQELYRWWQWFNSQYLRGALRRPVIVVTDGESKLGAWKRETRTLAIAARHIAEDPWLDVLETLRHEMAHQLADEVLGGADETPHGPAFAAACDKLRVRPGARRQGHATAEAGESDRLRDVVAKLLSLASSPNEHEAAAAMRKARHLLLKYNIDQVERDVERRFGSRTLGPVRGRHHPWEQTLASLLNDYFFVEVIWVGSFDARTARRGTQLAIYGTETNLELADYVHAYLTGLVDQLWRDYKRARGLSGDRERLRYYEGLLRGFLQKLAEQQTRLVAEHALVPVRDDKLHDFFRWHHPRVRTTLTAGVAPSRVYQDGKRAGRGIDIRRPLATRGDGVRGQLPG